MPKEDDSRTLDRSAGAEGPRRWGETIRNAMFQLTNDELAAFLGANPAEARRLEAALKRVARLRKGSR